MKGYADSVIALVKKIEEEIGDELNALPIYSNNFEQETDTDIDEDLFEDEDIYDEEDLEEESFEDFAARLIAEL